MNAEEAIKLVEIRSQEQISKYVESVMQEYGEKLCRICNAPIILVRSDGDLLITGLFGKQQAFKHLAIMGHFDCMEQERVEDQAELKRHAKEQLDKIKSKLRYEFRLSIPFDCKDATIESVDPVDRSLLEVWNLSDGFGFYIYGTVGSGKTYASVALANKIADQILSEIPLDVQDYQISQIERSLPRMVRSVDLFTHTQKNNFQVPNEFLNAQILFLDDMGTENVTDFKRETIYNLLDHRASKSLITFITSNLPFDMLKSNYFERVASRVIALTVPVEFKGADRRFGILSERVKALRARTSTNQQQQEKK